MRYDPDCVIDAAYVKARLEDAGATLLALPAKGTAIAAYRVAWPEIFYAAEEIAANTPDARRPPVPSARAITDMDETLFRWLPLVGEAAVETRRILWLRSLVSPLTGKHLWSWRRLQDRLGLNRETLAVRHGRGVDRIVTRLNRPEWTERPGCGLP